MDFSKHFSKILNVYAGHESPHFPSFGHDFGGTAL